MFPSADLKLGGEVGTFGLVGLNGFWTVDLGERICRGRSIVPMTVIEDGEN